MKVHIDTGPSAAYLSLFSAYLKADRDTRDDLLIADLKTAALNHLLAQRSRHGTHDHSCGRCADPGVAA